MVFWRKPCLWKVLYFLSFFLQRFETALACGKPAGFSGQVMTSLFANVEDTMAKFRSEESSGIFYLNAFPKFSLVYLILVTKCFLNCYFNDLLLVWFAFLKQLNDCKVSVLFIALTLQIDSRWNPCFWKIFQFLYFICNDGTWNCTCTR